MTPTWFEHAAFWSGVRRATVAPRSHNDNWGKKIGSTEIWTRIAGFKVQSANHYTIEPWLVSQIFKVGKDHKCLSHSMYSVNFVFCVQISYFADIISGLSWGKYDIWTKKIILFPAGFEPATLCVWSTRDNHYTKETPLAIRKKIQPSHLGIEPRTFGLEVQRAILCANGTHVTYTYFISHDTYGPLAQLVRASC